MDKQKRCRKSERGVALILALLAIVLLGILAAGVAFTSQAQSWTALNYRQTAQSRYAAEAGIQSTMNWLASSGYSAPTNFASYDMTKNPVQSGGNPVVLSATSGSSNYPDSSVVSAYPTSKSLAGVPNASYSTSATLLRMNPGGGVSWLAGGGAGNVIQTWQITSQGTVGGLRKATVQVTQTFERSATPLFTYGVAADGNSCPAVNFSGGSMDSWNSANGSYGSTQQNSGGNIGTNGNVTLSGGSTVIHGTISDSSNITVGSCPDGITNNVGGPPYPWDGLQKLNQTISYPNPTAPSTPNTNINANSNTCWSGAPTGCTTTTASNTICSSGTCTTTTGPAVQIAPGTYGNLTSNSNLHLSAGTYNFNSLSLNGGSITLDSTPVIINLGGTGISSGGTLFTANSSTTINDGGIPSNLQLVSACCLTGTPPAQMSNPPVITMNSSSSAYAAIYAPNAYVHITGSSHFLGAVVAQKVTSDSSGGFSYDVALANSLQQVGSFKPVGGFSWSKF